MVEASVDLGCFPLLSASQGNAYVKGLKRRGYASCVVQLLAPSASRISRRTTGGAQSPYRDCVV
jgi:hypothetical protein